MNPLTREDENLWSICRRRLGGPSREWTRSLGREGLQAAATLLICVVVLLVGAVVVTLTWTRTDVVSATIPVGAALVVSWAALVLVALASGILLNQRLSISRIWTIVIASGLAVLASSPWLWRYEWTVRLPALWIMLVCAVAIAGFLLSAQVGKPWVRMFSLCGLVILGLLLITLGRNERVNLAAQAAQTDYRQLAQIHDQAEDPPPVAEALVAELCRLAEADDCGGVIELTEEEEELGSCLPGWTYEAFGEWAEAASIDREVAATAALARCQLGAFDPGAASVDSEQREPLPANGSDAPGDPEEVDQQAEVAAQAQASVDARMAVAEAVSIQRSEANLIETFADGANGILSSISGPNEFAVFRFSGATWLVLLGLMLLWYRLLEIRAGSHGLGPVQIDYEEAASPGAEAGGHEDAGHLRTSQAVFKQAVVQNVPEPGAVPGAQALAPVGDLISSTDGTNKLLTTGVVDAVRTILATRSGYTVMYNAHQEPTQARPKDGSDDRSVFVVFVRLRNTQNGTQMASIRFESEYLAEAAQLAGYWVAGWIISRSRYVPEWAVWSERDAHAFYSLQWRQGDDLPLQAHGVVDPNRIQAPVNALVLAQRAYAYQISPKERKDPDSDGPYTLNALEDFARAAYHRPRYPVARYRRAVALSSLMEEGVNVDAVFLPRGSGEGTESPSKNRLLHLFRDLIGYGNHPDLRVRAEREAELADWIRRTVEDRQFPVDMRRAMLELAFAWLVEAKRSVGAAYLAQFRPSERRFWHEFNRSGTRRDWTMLVRVSQEIVKVRLAHLNPPYSVSVGSLPADLVERAREADSHWQISYNIGCYFSLLAKNAKDAGEKQRHREAAFDWLERCLDRPFSGQLVREWIDRDSDLQAVREPDEESATEEDEASWRRWRLRVPRMPVQIHLGDRSSAVKRLQQRLNQVGAPKSKLLDDGWFGTETLEAVEEFQFAHDLRVTGNPDLTMLALLETLAEESDYRAAASNEGLR